MAEGAEVHPWLKKPEPIRPVELGAIAPVPRIPARFLGFLPMTRLESAASAGGWLERRGASPVK
jgi:hypothetical protein